MVNQPPTRRLLTEAAAALVYRTAAQVDTAADARAAAAITAQKGAASGLASLGADGKVPAAQLPPASLVRIALARTTDSATRSSAGNSNDDVLVAAGVAAGTYAVELLLLAKTVSTSGAAFTAQVGVSAGGLWGSLIYTYGSSPTVYLAAGSANTTPPAALNFNGGTFQTATAGAGYVYPLMARGVLTLTATAAFQVQWGASLTPGLSLAAGSALSLTKIG